MRRLPNRYRWITVILVMILFCGSVLWHWWWPFLDRELFKLGFRAPLSIGNVEFRLKDTWYPVESSEYGIGQLTLKAKRPTIIVAKPESMPFQKIQTIAISKLDAKETDTLAKDFQHRVKSKKFSWGTAVTLVGGRAALVQEYGIVISDDDSRVSHLDDVLEDVLAIAAHE